jgi:hypothetical protein
MPTPPTVAASSRLRTALAGSTLFSSARLLLLAQIACFVLFAHGVSHFVHHRTGMTSTIMFGDHFEPGRLEQVKEMPGRAVQKDSYGYDGQFYAQLAVDPLLVNPHLHEAVDTVAFRSRRILFSWTAWLLGLGQTNWVIHAYAAQNVLFWIATALLLQHWLPLTNWFNFCRWAGILFSSGLAVSVTHALTDGPALFLMLLGFYFCDRGWRWVGIATLGVSALGKETSLAAGLGAVDVPPKFPTCFAELMTFARTIVPQGLVLLLPMVLWMTYVWWRVGLEGAGGLRAFSPPFVALAAAVPEVIGFFGVFGRTHAVSIALCFVAVVTQIAYFFARWQWQSTWWRVGVPYAILGMCMGIAVTECFPGASTRSLLPMLAAFNLSLKPTRSGWLWMAAGNLGIFHGLHELNLIR